MIKTKLAKRTVVLMSAFVCSLTSACASTLFLAGDSTLDDHGRKEGVLYASWGTDLEKSMKSGNRVANFAKSGASTKSFVADGHWARLVANVAQGDFVAIQFGHNDQKQSTEYYRETRWADPKGLFREIVRGWVAEIRAKGATPILLSPIPRGTFASDGKTLVDHAMGKNGVRLADYRDAMRELSVELGCDYVDMNTLVRDELERVGQEKSNSYFFISTGQRIGKDGEPKKDVTHPVKAGAGRFAQLFLDDVRKRHLPVADLFVSPEAAGLSISRIFSGLGQEASPRIVSRRITDQFLSTRPENYFPAGYRGNNGYGWNITVQYSVVSLWANALECAGLTGDKERIERLVRLFDDFKPGGELFHVCSRPYHVDDSIFGALPYEIYLQNGDAECLEMGNWYAETQWAPPCWGTYVERHNASREKQAEYFAMGYSPQTRLWIDDMYMITVLQSQAYRATGDRKYIDRAAREMAFYLDNLQLKDGSASGLFYHAPDVPYVWGRGDGWMAAGMALVLDRLPDDSPCRERIMEGYRLMMATLLKYQRADGLWCQLVDRPEDGRNWGETSATAMFTYAYLVGIRRGWLDAAEYGPRARKAYEALCSRLDEYANLADVCEGTGKKNDLEYYYARGRVNGDPHGQAPMLWIAGELLKGGVK